MLVGEAKWTALPSPARALAKLDSKAERLPLAAGRRVYTALWLKDAVRGPPGVRVIAPRGALDVLC